MAEAAYARGFVSLGFSEHAPQPIDAKWGMADEPGYIAEVCALRAEYAGRMKIWLGIEYELTKVTDIVEIMKFGVMMTPALVVDGQVKVLGKVPDPESIKPMLA
jgi:histidinol phosphatase-like PHP family hydrolase